MQIPSGCAKRINPRSDIHAVAEDVIAALYDVADVYADPELDFLEIRIL